MVKKTTYSIIFILISLFAFNASALDIKKAKKFYAEAERYYDTGDFKKALDTYTKAFELSQKYTMYFNIAQCHRQLKHYDKAVFFYRRFLNKFPTSEYKDEVLRQIKAMVKASDELKTLIKTKGRISIITHPDGATVFVDSFDGKPEGVSPVVIYVSPGTHLLVLKKEGYKTTTKKITVTKGNMEFLELSLPSLTGKNDTTKPVDNNTTKPKDNALKPKDNKKDDGKGNAPEKAGPTPFYSTWWFYTGAGIAAVSTGAGIYFGIHTLSLSSQFDDEKSSQNPDQGKLDQLKKDGESSAMMSDIFLGVGIAAAVATVVGVVLYNPKSSSSDNNADNATDGKAKSFFIMPGCTSSYCGINASFRF